MKWQDINNHWRRHEENKQSEQIEINLLNMPKEIAKEKGIDKTFPKFYKILESKESNK